MHDRFPRLVPFRRIACAAGLATLLSAGSVTAAVSTTAPAFGPAFGNTRYRTEIGPFANDTDDYVTPLIAGETLTATVAADGKSPLKPTVVLLDPLGNDRTPEPIVAKKGASVTLRNVPIDMSGPWTVRVTGAAGSVGAYSAKFSVKPPKPLTVKKLALGGADPVERNHSFQAVDGAFLAAQLKLGRGKERVAGIVALADPTGAPAALGASKWTGTTHHYASSKLEGEDGAYVATVGLDEGTVRYDLRLVVSPPIRPKGTIVLSPLEPRLSGGPYQGNAATPVRIQGVNFSENPRPTVWFGDQQATVLTVAPLGSSIDVVPPPFPEDSVVDVTVVNPDGQAGTRANYFSYSVPEPPALAAVTPGTASVYVNAVLRYTVTLTRPAPVGGFTVTLAATGGVGAIPADVTVAATATSATFDLTAAAAPAAGRITATAGEVSLGGDVTVVAIPGGGGEDPPPPLPDEIDISGWVVRQQNSARDYTIPAGTRLRQGDYIVIGRAATKAQFETYWGVTLGANVLYLTNDPANSSSSTDDWPSINGGETYELRNAAGTTIDGPSAAMSAAALENWQRTAGQPAGTAGSWTVSTSVSPGAAPTPGTGPADSVKHGVFLSEFSDVASGSGNFVYEFVELHFDGNP